jgi:hypothetical protein
MQQMFGESKGIPNIRARMLVKHKIRLKVLERYVGKEALRFGLFSEDLRSVGTNAAVIQSLALNGPQYLLQLTAGAEKAAADWCGILVATTPATYHDRVKELEKKGYISREKRLEVHRGVSSYLWDLTYRGAIAAVSLPGVRRQIWKFMEWKRPDPDASGERRLLRLPGLENVSAFIEQGIAPEFWQHFIGDVMYRVFRVCDINETFLV